MGMKVKQGANVIGLFLKTNLSTAISMKRSRRELSIDMFIHKSIYKNDEITFIPCFTFPPNGLVFTVNKRALNRSN